MGDEHRRKTVLSSDAGQKIVHFEPGQSVESAERLVEQQHFRSTDQRARQRDPLSLSARQEDRGPFVGAFGEPDRS